MSNVIFSAGPSGSWRVVSRPVRVGDYIRLKTSGGFSFSKPGDILLVSAVSGGLAKVKAKDHPRKAGDDPEYLWNYTSDEYEVVESASGSTGAKKTTSTGSWRVVSRPVQVGDHIRLKTNGNFSFNEPGDILLVSAVSGGLAKVKAKDHVRKAGDDPEYLWNYTSDEYEVVEPASGSTATKKSTSGGLNLDGVSLSSLGGGTAKKAATPTGEWRVVSRAAVAGDYIRLKTNGNFSFNEPGDILLVSAVSGGLAKVKAKDHVRKAGDDPEYLWNYTSDEYEVVEPASGSAPAKKATAKTATATKATSASPSSDFEIAGTTIKKYIGKGGAVVVPHGITIIGKDAFEKNDNVTSVVLPSTVERLEFGAFWQCRNLTSINIPDSVTYIGDYALGWNKLVTLVIPKSVTYLGKTSFSGCSELTSVTLPARFKGRLSEIFSTVAGKNIFHFADVNAPASPSAPSAPAVDLPLDTVELPAKKTTAKKTTATASEDGEWRVVDRAPKVGDYIRLKGSGFSFNQPGDILPVHAATEYLVTVLASDHPRPTGQKDEYEWNYTNDEFEVVERVGGAKKTTASKSAPAEKAGTTKSLGGKKLGGKPAELKPEPYEVVDKALVSYRGDGRDLVIPDGVEVVKRGALPPKDAVRSLSLPASLRELELGALAQCTDIEKFEVAKGNAHFRVEGDCLLTGDGKTLVRYAVGSPSVTLTVPDGVVKVGVGALAGAAYLRELSLPASVEVIEDAALFGCAYLQTVTLPKALCDRLPAVLGRPTDGIDVRPLIEAGEDFRLVGSRMLEYRGNDRDVVIPDGVTFIDSEAFPSEAKIVTVTIPASVTEIEEATFADLPYLTEIRVAEENPAYRSYNGALYTKDLSVLLQYPVANRNTSYNAPEELRRVGMGAFYYCREVHYVNLGAVESIGESAFLGCMHLFSLTATASEIDVGEDAFSECFKLERVDAPALMARKDTVFPDSRV